VSYGSDCADGEETNDSSSVLPSRHREGEFDEEGTGGTPNLSY
jgi:hypothetical protein